MACICVGGGGGCKPNGTVQDYLSGFGFSYDPNDPLAATYRMIISQDHVPGNNPQWEALAEACMRARAMLYCQSSPGDCNVTAASVGSELSTVGQFTSAGIGAGSELAGALGLASGAALGAATLGAGVVASAIIDIFQNHAAAEARQANALCQLCPQFTASMRQVDSAVANRVISPTEGAQLIAQLAQNFSSEDASLAKSCNAFCGYNAIAKCLADISPYYYQQNPPIQPIAQAAPPALAASAPAPPPVQAAPVQQAQAPRSSSVVTANSIGTSPQSFFSLMPTWVWIILGVLVAILLLGEDEPQQPTVIVERKAA